MCLNALELKFFDTEAGREVSGVRKASFPPSEILFKIEKID